MKQFYHLPCKDDAPYPVASDLRPDRRTARMLLLSYGSPDSELTAITQYIYHFMMLSESYRPIAFALKQTAEVEMHHLSLLGNCIRQLGEEPRFWSWRGQMRGYWNGGFVQYGKNIKEMLENDLLGEYCAIDEYRKVLSRVNDPQIAALIGRILADEEVHMRNLESILGTID